MSAVSCCGDASGGTTSGIGTTTYTFNPGVAGTYTVTMYFDYDAATPFFNEYGAINSGGSAQAGIGYEVFNAHSTSSNIVLFGANGIAGGEVYGAPNGLNEVPGQSSNFFPPCTAGASCNADVGMALSYNFTLGSGQEAVITAAASLTNPGGFSLETIHPVDANNGSETDLYLTGSYSIQPSGVSPVPEPTSWLLLGTIAALLGGGLRRRIAAK
jgi:hypothetical protein